MDPLTLDPLGSLAFLAELEGVLAPKLVARLRACWQQTPDLARHPFSADRLLWLRPQGDRAEHAVNSDARISVPGDALAMPGRLQPLVALACCAAQLRPWAAGGLPLAVQVHDEAPTQAGVLCFDAPAGAARPELGTIPDPYCLGSRGYLRFRCELQATPPPPWRQRRSLVIWRGATTGSHAITPRRLAYNRRFQLCAHSQRRAAQLDARFTSVVQCRDAEASQAVRDELERLSLLAPPLQPLHMAQCRWIVDIDGNVNSWGLLWKLLSGSCVLRVMSDRAQWYHHRLIPFQHLVPIAPDLADLEQQLDWCFANPAACEAIAEAGQQLALQVLNDLGADLLTALRWACASTRPCGWSPWLRLAQAGMAVDPAGEGDRPQFGPTPQVLWQPGEPASL
ncbi:MAG: hypothetical protein FJ051_00185 [Cyanobacteria bacterium M_surface_9_m1_291]|nr:hypothetical protein [Cyanobacteria bacterium M_surface_9_m1_291]